MGEYDDVFIIKENERESESKKMEDMDELDLENDFEPFNEEFYNDKDLDIAFKLKDELKSNENQFERIFIPKDEKEIDINLLKKLGLKKYIKSQDKKDLDFKENPNGKLKENEELAEMVCIGLGDGSIPHTKTEYKITLNKSQEPQYAIYVYELMKKTLNKRPTIYEPKKADAIKLKIHRKNLIEALIDKGHEAGDKKKNQVDVPQWIKGKEEFQKGGLRGLVDTDGSIHIHKHNKTLHISFNNASFPLVEDFKKLCEKNGIKTVKISHVKGKDTYTTGLESKGDVSKFIYKVKPKKWEYRAKTFGLVLKSISDPEKRVEIEKELHKSYTDKRVNFSFEYRDLLKKLCIKHDYNVSSDSLIKELEKMLTYDDNYTGLSKERKKELNFYGKKIIEDLRRKWK